MDSNDCSILLNLSKDILVSIIEKLSAEVDLLRTRLAESEERNNVLQNKLPKLINNSIKSALTTKKAFSRSNTSFSCPSGNRGSAAGISVSRPGSRALDISNSVQFAVVSTSGNVRSNEPRHNGSVGASLLTSYVARNPPISLSNNNSPVNASPCLGVRRKRQLVIQKSQPDFSPPAIEEACQKIEDPMCVDSQSINANNSSFLLHNPSELITDHECVPNMQSSSEEVKLNSSQFPQHSSPVFDLTSDSPIESSLGSSIMEHLELDEATLQQVDAHIQSSYNNRTDRYWQAYILSKEWTRATCALMSCLFSQQQMETSTVFGRKSASGEFRDRLPVKLVHYIVTTVSRRFEVPPSKVRARMAQKCKDARRVARRASAPSSSN